jgi:hypothetical protein
MDDFERQLKNALARKEQPSTLEAKVFAAIARERTAPKPAPRLFWRWEAVAVAATILLAAVSWTGHERELQERAAGEAAKARLQLALRITVTQLGKIQRTVRTATEEE